MTDLHQIVQVGALTNDGLSDLTSIDAGVGPDRGVGTDHYASDMGDGSIRVETKTRAPDHRAGSDAGASFNTDPIHNDGARQKLYVVTDIRPRTHEDAAVQDGIGADVGPGLDDAQRANAGRWIDNRVGVDGGGWMTTH